MTIPNIATFDQRTYTEKWLYKVYLTLKPKHVPGAERSFIVSGSSLGSAKCKWMVPTLGPFLLDHIAYVLWLFHRGFS